MGFGDSPYGVGSYGAGAVLSVVAAWAISTHGVRIVLSEEPAHVDQFADGDALNPRTWTVTNTSTGTALTVVAASMDDDSTVDLVTLEALGDDLEDHLVIAVALASESGDPFTGADRASFPGVVQTLDPVDSIRVDIRPRDLANNAFSGARGFGHAGTLVIGSDGDFATEAGPTLVKKLVLRRLNTVRNSFRHLPGYGVATLEKEPLASGGDLLTYLKDVEDQARQEPDVSTARARGSIDRSGVLIIQLSITPVGGGTISMRMGSRGGALVEF